MVLECELHRLLGKAIFEKLSKGLDHTLTKYSEEKEKKFY